MNLSKWITAAVLAAFILSACAGTKPAAAVSLAGSAWKLVSFGPAGAENAALPGKSVTLTFDDQSRVGGNAGCNSYGGSYTEKQGELAFGQLMSTLMACAEDGVMQQEQAFLSALGKAARYEINGDQLVITSADGATRLTFTRGS